MFSTSDTIVAIATPPGRGGIGVVRISGPAAFPIAQQLTGRDTPFEPRHATLATVRAAGASLDRVVVTAFRAPNSYTGDDVAEVSGHGSPVLLRTIVSEAVRCGARLAEPGEFTFRAYLNRRIDLVQAEAVRDLVNAVTPLQARAAFDQLEGTLTTQIAAIDEALFDLCARLEASLDFPGEGYHFVEAGVDGDIAALASSVARLLKDAERGRLIREGAEVVLAGRPNTGKSSLFNRLAGAGRAIVTDVPGTTRDLITETIDLEGVPVTIVDTAGVRLAPGDAIEQEGITRAAAARSVAAVVLVVLDRSAPLTPEDRQVLRETTSGRRIVVANKSDLAAAWSTDAIDGPPIAVSAVSGDGIDTLRRELIASLTAGESGRDLPAITNIRHASLLARAHEALTRAAAAAAVRVPEEFVLADLNEARALLEDVTGTRTADDTLQRIFASFCIGK